MKTNTNSIIQKNDKLYPCEYDYEKNFFLLFHLMGSTADFLELGLPYPTYLERINKGYLIAWALEGSFNTIKNQSFLNDVIARFLLTFGDKNIRRLPYKPKFENSKNAHVIKKAYNLKSFSTKLKSLKKKEFIPQRAEMFEDVVFWAIKLYCEDLIREYKVLSYAQVEDFAFHNFLATKERSTLKAKCKNIYNYYEKRDFKLSNEKKYKDHQTYLKESKMSRTEHLIKVHKQRRDSTKSVIESLITGVHADKYKKKNGKFNAVLIAKATKISEKTVRKYLKEISQPKED